MKIAIVSAGFVDVVLPLAKYLSRHIEVDLYLLFSQSYKYESIINFSDRPVKNGFLDQETVRKILGSEILFYLNRAIKVKIFMFKNLKIWDVKNIILIYHFTRHVKKENYRLVHFNGNNIFQLSISFLLGRKTKVHTIHDFLSHTEVIRKLAQRLMIPERINRYLATSPRHIIVHARCIRDTILKTVKSAKNIHAIYYGPLEIYPLFHIGTNINGEYDQIVFFGRIDKYKGISYLLEAFKKIRRKYAKLKLVIAGSGDFNAIYGEVPHSNGITLINRYIDNQELAGLITGSTIVVCPYTDATQSGIVQTAYAFAKPVIVTDVGGLSEVVEPGVTGLIVPACDSNALSAAILELLADQNKLKKMASNIKSGLKEELEWDYIAKQTVSVYNQALKKTKKQPS